MILQSIVIKRKVRPGTARHAAMMCLIDHIGCPRSVVLEALRNAELDWQDSVGRRTVGVAPGGWLLLYGATFAP